MDGYLEQSVAAEGVRGAKWMYALCWLLLVPLSILAMFCAARMLSVLEERGPVASLGWMAGVLMCLGLGMALMRCKDYLCREYDYLYRNDALEVWMILNHRRRRRVGYIDLRQVRSIETGISAQRTQKCGRCDRWYVHAGPLCRVGYTWKNVPRVALLELNDEMLAGLRRSGHLRRDVWRGAEGK